MPNTVIDTTVLVSAFLRPSVGGASFDLLQLAHEGAFELFLSDDILIDKNSKLLYYLNGLEPYSLREEPKLIAHMPG